MNLKRSLEEEESEEEVEGEGKPKAKRLPRACFSSTITIQYCCFCNNNVLSTSIGYNKSIRQYCINIVSISTTLRNKRLSLINVESTFNSYLTYMNKENYHSSYNKMSHSTIHILYNLLYYINIIYMDRHARISNTMLLPMGCHLKSSHNNHVPIVLYFRNLYLMS